MNTNRRPDFGHHVDGVINGMRALNMGPGGSSDERTDCIILGAGILALTIACELLDHEIRPTIVARDLPEDLHSTSFSSPWAGANWSSSASNEQEERRDRNTFERFAQISSVHPDLIAKVPFRFYAMEDEYPTPWYKDLVHEYRTLDQRELPTAYSSGAQFESFVINGPKYYTYLANKLRQADVKFVRKTLSKLDDTCLLYPSASLVINATGLGARYLWGVEDKNVYPVKGQTVLIHAPQFERRYIIPRPGPDGLVILGGTAEPDVYETSPSLEVAERIMQDACQLCPELGPWENLTVISHQCGLRPMRKGGMRLEVEARKVATSTPTDKSGEQIPGSQTSNGKGFKMVHCIHAYGIGSAGYQASWGVAAEVAGLAIEILKGKAATA